MHKEVIGNCELYLGDCMDLMIQYPDKYFDLAIVDPPYGGKTASGKRIDQATGGTFNRYKTKAENWNIEPKQSYFVDLFRVSKKQIICGGNYFDLPKTGGWIVWDKGVAYPNFSKCELLWTSFLGHVEMEKVRWSGFVGLGKTVRIHPTQKPVALYKGLLSKYAKPGDKILDTHFGSGSLAVACNEMSFELVASEIDHNYFEDACERIRIAVTQEKLNFGSEA